jgi:four helix bundle protein
LNVARIEKFEDLKAWQTARRLTRDLYALTGQGNFARDYVLRDQTRRAAISVLSNIAEGFERGGNSELIQYLSIAKGSIAEVRAQLFIAYDCGYITSEQFATLHAMASDIGGKLGALMAYLRRSGMKGAKYRI